MEKAIHEAVHEAVHQAVHQAVPGAVPAGPSPVAGALRLPGVARRGLFCGLAIALLVFCGGLRSARLPRCGGVFQARVAVAVPRRARPAARGARARPAAPRQPAARRALAAAPVKKGSPAAKRKRRVRRLVRRRPAARAGQKPRPVINFINLHTGERLAVTRMPSRRLINRFLRCRWTGRQTRMDPRPFRWVLQAARHFGATEVHVVSGYRHPKFNEVLRKKGRQVARRSKHRLGRALDFRLVGVTVQVVYRYLRARRLGGVGRYPESKFLHLDSGPVRSWGGR
jgi:uncharacterized protein YcbK (DUF882 family)